MRIVEPYIVMTRMGAGKVAKHKGFDSDNHRIEAGGYGKYEIN